MNKERLRKELADLVKGVRDLRESMKDDLSGFDLDNEDEYEDCLDLIEASVREIREILHLR